jgi:hypothetical protein
VKKSNLQNDVYTSHQSHTKATLRLHQGYTKATPRPPQGYPKATLFVPILAIRVRKFRRNAGCPGGAEGLKTVAGCGRIRAVTWSMTGLEFIYAIIR